MFGLEACAATLFREIRFTITYDGTYVDDRHIGAITNTMTFRGDLMSFTRHGINRVDQGPILKSSFEESVDNMSEAAMFNESDFGGGVSTSVMFGQTAHVGTGMCTVRVGGDRPTTSTAAPSALRKSRVRVSADVVAGASATCAEYIDAETWKISGGGNAQATEDDMYRPPSPA